MLVLEMPYARETRNYERDQAKSLEEIRKAAERM